MNTTNNNGQITANYSFMSFAREKGHLEAGEFTNSKTGENFVALVFTEVGDRGLMVSVSSKLGRFATKEELAAYVVAHKDELQVVKIDNPEYDKPLYSLCKRANNMVTVDLGF